MNAARAIPATGRWAGPLLYAAVLSMLILVLRLIDVPFIPSEVSRAVEGWALLAAAGKLQVAEMAATQSPASFLAVISVQWASGLDAAQSAALVAALLGAALLTLWLRALFRAGHPPLVAALLTGLIAGNPLFAASLFAGPDVLLVLLALWIFASTIFPLRRYGDVDAFMQCSAALCLLVFAGPIGLAAAVLAMMSCVLPLPHDIPPRHVPAAWLVLLFPVLLAAGGLVFVNWTLLHDAWGFLPDVLRYGPDLPHASFDAVPTALLSVAISCPLVLIALIDGRLRGLPAVQLAVLTFGVAGLAAALTLAASPLVAGVAGLAGTAALAARWGKGTIRTAVLAVTLLLGMIGGAAALAFLPAQEQQPRLARAAADAALGQHLATLRGVMIDASRFPEVVAARGSARGLVAYADTGFEVALLEKRVLAAHVVVPAPDPSRPYDRVSRTFPELHAAGLPGFALTYDRGGWRVYSRLPEERRPS